MLNGFRMQAGRDDVMYVQCEQCGGLHTPDELEIHVGEHGDKGAVRCQHCFRLRIQHVTHINIQGVTE